MTSPPLAITTSIVLASALAHADDATDRAAELFKQGRALITAGNVADACAAFASSLELDPQLGTKLNLGDCWAKLGRNADAYRMFEDAEKDASRTDKPGRATYAREQLTSLRSKVGLIRLRIAEPNLAGLAIELGPPNKARDLSRDTWAQLQIVDPGPVVITARAPDRAAIRVEKSIAAGDEITIEVAALPPLAKVDGIIEGRTELKRSRTPLWIGAGVGVGLFGGSAVIGFVARSKYDKAVTAQDRDAIHRAAVLADVGTGIAIAGGVALVAGVVWYLIAPEQPVTLAPSAIPGGTALVLEGTF